MKIAFVAHTVGRRLGVPRCVAELVDRFSRAHDVTVLATAVSDLAGCPFRLVRVPTLNRSRFLSYVSFLALGAATMRLLRTVGRSCFDIVHSTVGPVCSANVATMHFCQAAEWRLIQKGAFPAPSDLSRISGFDYDSYRWLMLRAERRLFGKHGPAGLIAVSEGLRQDFLRYYGDVGRRILVIPNGVDPEEYHPRYREVFRAPIRKLHGIPAEAPVVLFVGGDWERKGLALLIGALGRIHRKDAALLVVGAGDVARYARLAVQRGVAERVIFAGRPATVVEYYAAADVLALPSLYEPFGLVVTEAMASGLPVIVSDQVGASFLVADGPNGFVLAEPLSEWAIAETLDVLFAEPERRREMGVKARLTAENLSWDNVAYETMRVYEHVLGIDSR